MCGWEPECVARMAMLAGRARHAALVSGFPRQVTGSFLEWMLLPLIHFVLLGFLPMAKMRKSTGPGFAAGCGQFHDGASARLTLRAAGTAGLG